MIKHPTGTLLRLALAGILFLRFAPGYAQSSGQAPDFSQGAPSGEGFTALIAVFKTWADFVSGPLALVFVFLGIAFCVFVWIFAPKAGEVIGFSLRIIVAGFVLFNAGAFITTFMVAV